MFTYSEIKAACDFLPLDTSVQNPCDTHPQWVRKGKIIIATIYKPESSTDTTRFVCTEGGSIKSARFTPVTESSIVRIMFLNRLMGV